MANSKARCAGCKQYRVRDELTRVGLSSICADDPSCRRAILDRQKEKVNSKVEVQKRREKNRLSLRLRRHIRDRDQTCRVCGSSYTLEVHHILYRSQGGPDASWNLILLCDEHHRMAHSRKRYWQPVLMAYIWLWYCEGRRDLNVPQVEKILARRGMLPDRPGDPDDGRMID